ncbi:MAG: UbiD family decarboxylase [Proteobacteria bacterium]|nr:UbiD family decarboxylase [Pseudomonadota bacterium]TDI57633.1 MAG: UbiD family decarboxylase [Alphaproteobacteria bacterium]
MAAKGKGTAKIGGIERGYRDLHEHIEALRQAGLLLEIEREINKDTEMHPLVRWQFRGGIAEADRKAFLFTNVTDSKGRKYDIPVLVCGLAGNRAIYQTGMGCGIDEIGETWIKAINAPLAPNIVASADAPCHEVVFEGEELRNGNGLDALPVPISTPGWDNAPYTSSSHFITKDPGTGVQNMGNYRGQLKAPDRLGLNTSRELRTGGYLHWLEWKKRGEKMPCAVVLGCPPVVSFTAVQKLPEGEDELAVSGALAGTPLNVVAAKTVDLLVPAEAEVVIEGYVDTEYLEPEAPFGESHGHVNLTEYNAYMDITAITRRKDAVITSWVSQVTPSESSAIRRPAYEARLLAYLRDHLGIQGLIGVSAHEPLTSLTKLIVVTFERTAPRTEIWRALYGVAAHRRADGKWLIAVNDDIDADQTDAIFWAMSYRAKPHRDVVILKHKDEGHGPRSRIDAEDSAVLVDATLKENFPPVSLPKREFMEKAAKIWAELGLPELKPEAPWFGYDLGEWNEELERMAELAVRSEYWETGKIYAQRRRKDVEMNTEVRTLDEGGE